MPKFIEVLPPVEDGFTAEARPIGPILDHQHDMQQIGVEHHWRTDIPQHPDGVYEALPVMECKSPYCAYQQGLKRRFYPERGVNPNDPHDPGWEFESRDLEWDDSVHTEYVVFPRDETGAHIR